MNPHSYVFTSSRGRRMEGELKVRYIHVLPGGKLKTLCDIAYRKLHFVPGKKIVYFVAGIPDICSLDRKKFENYEESCLEKGVDHVERFKSVILEVESIMKSINCKVVFATVTTMSFHVWNNNRLSQGKTSFLKYENEYENMQEKLNSCLHEINNFITSVNSRNQVLTPFLHSPVQKCKKGKIRYIYSKLVDGVHPGDDLVRIWIERMNEVIEQNERNL